MGIDEKTLEYINSLGLKSEQLETIIQLIEEEKEASWADGYDSASFEL